MAINSVMTHNKVQPGTRRQQEESKQLVRNQNGKTVGRKKRLKIFITNNHRMKIVLEEKEKKRKIISQLIVNVYMITILVAKLLETIGIPSKHTFR
jgi:hypothetical protein